MKTKSKIDMMAVALLIAAAAFLTGCGHGTAHTDTNTAGGTNGSKGAPPSPALLAGDDPQTAITNASMQLRASSAYRIRKTTVFPKGGAGLIEEGQSSSSITEYVAPDRFHNVGEGREVISIGKTTYIKKNGEWQNLGTQMSDMQDKMKKNVENMTAEEKAEATKGLTADYKLVGDEVLDATPTTVYEMHSQMKGISDIVTKYWIAKSDGLFRRQESTGTSSGVLVKTTAIYEYGSDVKIEAPIP